MKVLLTTIAIGDEFIQEYNKLFYKSQKKYAEKHGYDFKVITEFLDKDIQTKATISFNKILVCSQEWSKEYDFIIFVDADILISPTSPSIHDYIDYGNSIGIIDEYSQPTRERRLQIQHKMCWETSATDYYGLCDLHIDTDMVFNSGVLVLQPKIHSDFLQNIYSTYIEKAITHPRKFHFEQSCIGYEIQKANLYKILDNKFNAIWPLIKIDSDIQLRQFFSENYFIHFAGNTDFNLVYTLH